VTRARLEDVALVMRGGQVLTGNTDVVSAMPGSSGNCESIGNVCGTDKSACIAGQYHTTWAALAAANSDSYMLYDQQCRAPEAYAPSCLPARLNAPVGGSYTGVVSITDSDGDGIANNIDNCPTTFNPIRPMDVNPMTNQGAQLDCDQDGVGDACDATPMGGLTQCLGPYPPFARAP